MHHHPLREIAKVVIGLLIADILSALWLSGAGLFPIAILGIVWTTAAVWPVVAFDLVLILLLAHYAWNMRLPIESPAERTLLILAGIIFLIVALAHLFRLIFGVPIMFGDIVIPLWLSWFGVAVAGYLSYASFHFALHKRS